MGVVALLCLLVGCCVLVARSFAALASRVELLEAGKWSRCCLGGRAELFEVCYWFFRLNVCAAVAFLLFNTSRESFEKNSFAKIGYQTG